MSGNSHQNRVFKKAVQRAIEAELAKRGAVPQEIKSLQGVAEGRVDQTKKLSRSTIEAYLLFIASGLYVVLSAFGITVSFTAGCLVLAVMAYCGIDLLWHISPMLNKPMPLKVVATVILLVGTLDLARAGWIKTHAKAESGETALVNLFVQKVSEAIAKLQQPAQSAPSPAPSAPAATVSKPGKPFAVDVGPVMATDNPGSTPYAVLANRPLKPTDPILEVFPADIMEEVEFTNLLDREVLVTGYSAEAETKDGKWVHLTRLDSAGKLTFIIASTASPMPDALSSARQVRMKQFDEEGVVDQNVKPRQPIKGFVFFEYPQFKKPLIYTGKLRFSIWDSAGDKVTIPDTQHIRRTEDHVQAGQMIAGPWVNLSAAKVTYKN